MRKFVLTIALALTLGATIVSAQNNDRPDRKNFEAREAQRIEMMVKELNLNEKQTADFTRIMNGMRPNRGSQPARDGKANFEERRKAMDDSLKTILTDEQFKKFQELNQRRGGNRGGRGNGDGPRGGRR